jgi:hypothetical protein
MATGRQKKQAIIEITQEQWQAIARQAKEYEKLRMLPATEADNARVLRIAWMRRMGLDEDEIAESIRDDPPVNVREEIKQLKALDSLDKITPPPEVLRTYAIKY